MISTKARAAGAGGPQPAGKKPMVDASQTNILIVDDLPEKILVYTSILEELEQNLVTVRSGADALREVLTREFAVILLDVNMPGMDGLETAQLIRGRKSSSHIPIIFLTAFADEVRIAQGYATGAVDYIPTPVVPEILRAKVRVFVELFQMRQQVARQAEEQARRAAAEEAARRSAFLSEASRALASSLDFETTLRTLARLAVPQLAESSLVTLADERGDLGRTEGVWLDPQRCPALQVVAEGAQPADWLAEIIRRVLRGDRPEHHDLILPPAPLLHVAEDAAAGAEDFRAGSVLVLPLLARGKTLGALTLALGPVTRRFVAADAALAEELAGRAGIALDNASLVRDIQENDRRKNEFLAMLAHELRNPLAPVRSAVHVLHMRGPAVPELIWARDVIDRQVSHLVRLVDDLLDVSRITRGKIRLQQEMLDVAGVVGTALETSRPVIDIHGHELTVTLPPEPIRVRADPARLSQVLSNLLNNAAKYTPNGGRISLTVEFQRGEVVFRVRDSGMGIPREMLSKVFDLFTQVDNSLARSEGGLGIGLTMVRRLVELHGGTVEAMSDGPGKGSEFVVRLPAHSGEPNEAASESPSRTDGGAPIASRRILLVDDNLDAAESLATVLQLHGHQIWLAHSGPAALEVAASCRPEAVILDIGLPGMDGYEVARCLRANEATSDALLIAVSGYGQDQNRQRSREAGFDHHLTKPVEYPSLEMILNSHRPAEQSDSSLSMCG